MHRSKLHHHSTTSSATSRNSRLIVSPKSLAAFRLTTSSNLIGCSTGNSAGLLGHQLWAKKGRPRHIPARSCKACDQLVGDRIGHGYRDNGDCAVPDATAYTLDGSESV